MDVVNSGLAELCSLNNREHLAILLFHPFFNTVLCVDETKKMWPASLKQALTSFNTVVTKAEPMFPAASSFLHH